MNSDVIERLAAVDPHPIGDDPPVGAITAEAVLQHIEWRTDMQTQQRPTETTAEPRRRGLLVAVAAFATIVVAGMAVWLTGGSEGSPPADTTITPAPVDTTIPPTPSTITTVTESEISETLSTVAVTEVDDAPINGAFAALNVSDLDEFMALVDEGAHLPLGLFRGDTVLSYEELRRDAAFGIAIGRTYELGACDHAIPGKLTCDVAITDSLREGTEAPPVTKRMTFRTVGGRIVEWQNLSPGEIGQGQALIDFQRWNSEMNPDDPRLIGEGAPGGGNAFWITVGRAPDVTPLRIPEYLATLNG